MKESDEKSILSAGFNFGEKNIRSIPYYSLKLLLGLVPNQNKFVAYSEEAKEAIGFLSLTRHPRSIQSIRYVFTNPQYRRIGVAKKLMRTAIHCAKKDGAKKLFLNTDPTGFIPDFYKKMGFTQLTKCEAIWGGGKPFSKKFNLTESLFPVKLNNKNDLNLAFKIYYTCMGKSWIAFFENNINNFLFGYVQEYKNLFQRSIYLSEKKDCFIAIYKRPFKKTASVDVFFSHESEIERVFINLLDLLKQKNITYFKITIFNANNVSCFKLLKSYNFYPYCTIFLGKKLG